MKKLSDLLGKINYIFNRKQKIRLVLLFLIYIVATFFELLGVAVVVPLINVMIDPGIIDRKWYLSFLYDTFNFSDTTGFLIFMCIMMILVYVVKNVIVSIMYKLQYNFTFRNQRDIAKRLMSCYMAQSYSYHVDHNSADLIRSINSDVYMMFQAVISMLQLLGEILVCLTIGVYLFIMDKSITIGVLFFLSIFALLYVKVFRRYLSRIGNEDRKYAAGIVKWLNQSFGGIKETKVMGREDHFLQKFNENYDKWAGCEQIYRYLGVAPRPVMEAVCITALMIVIALKLWNGTQSAYFVQTMAIFAMAAFRLLPSFNRITSYLSVIMFNLPAFDAVYLDMKSIEDLEKDKGYKKEVAKLDFEDKIEIKDITFKYRNSEFNVLDHASATIRKNQSVALIGSSGAGKTTLADILLGALEPDDGSVYVDGIDIFRNLEKWKNNIGYIPQSIYLMDDTIENNILYGAEEDADEDRIRHALEQAQIEQFIDQLPDGIHTMIGENGIRLSGGQRQRIGIARALYLDPDVLVLDEATSALDNETEAAVMDAIDTLAGKKTLIIIAHRLSTIRNCDLVYKVVDGKIVPEKDLKQ